MGGGYAYASYPQESAVRRIWTSAATDHGGRFSEWFIFDITPEQVAKYAENGNPSVQIRSEATTTAIITVPVSYFDAVGEVAK
jgi:hypothetical protein